MIWDIACCRPAWQVKERNNCYIEEIEIAIQKEILITDKRRNSVLTYYLPKMF